MKNNHFLIRILTGSAVLSLVMVNALPVNTEDSTKKEAFNFYDFIMCGFDKSPFTCAKTKIGRLLDGWDEEIQRQMKSWGDEADTEIKTSGRQLSPTGDSPSQAAMKLQLALNELATILQRSLYRTLVKKPEHEEVEETFYEESDVDEKTKDKKKRKKTHPGNPYVKRGEEEDLASAVSEHRNDASVIQVGETLSVDAELVGPNKLRVKRENETEEGRGKKKKQKKAILKLLLLGAVLKAKIGLLLQLLTAHLQVKFFAIALAGLALNIARFWLDLKKGHSPQKVIYYEHAQHQHHYEHDDEGWGGAWSRSMDTKAADKKKDGIVETGATAEDLAFGGWARSYKH